MSSQASQDAAADAAIASSVAAGELPAALAEAEAGGGGGADAADADGKDDASSDTSGEDVPALEGEDGAEFGGGKDIGERMAEAAVHKETGNGRFKDACFTHAVDSYISAISALGGVPVDNAEANALLVSLHLNLSMTLIKLEDWVGAAKNAREALAVDGENIKALYRLSLANFRRGALEEAKPTYVRVCRLDPKNKTARRELAELKEALKAKEAERRAKFGGMFKQSLYGDKEEERQEKEAAAAAKAAREAAESAEADARLHAEWDAECERREQAAEAPVKFEDFKGEREAADKAAAEAAEAVVKAEEAKVEAAKRAARDAARRERESDVVRVEDEDDLKGVVRGYKKKSDGRTTSFFDNEASEEAKKLIGDITPQRVGGGTAAAAGASSAAAAAAAGGDGGGGAAGSPERRASGSAAASDWNKSGATWEEKDVSAWARGAMEARLQALRGSAGGMDLDGDPGALLQAFQGAGIGGGGGGGDDGFGEGGEGSADDTMAKLAGITAAMARVDVAVTGVKSCTGDASVAVIRGTKRALFDLEAELRWEATMDMDMGFGAGLAAGGLGAAAAEEEGAAAGSSRKKVFKGTIKFPELSNTEAGTEGGFESTVVHSAKKGGAATAAERKQVDKALDALKSSVGGAVQLFIEDLIGR
jgi:hypothetical protein